MKRLLFAAIAATALTTSFSGAAVASPPETGPTGFLCGFASTTNPNAEANTQSGEIDGGPLVDETDPTAGGTLHCTIQVGANSTHAASATANVRANDAYHASNASPGPGWFLPPTVFSYTAAPDQDVWICTEIRYDRGLRAGLTLYYSADNDDDPTTDTGHWTTNKTRECSLAISASTPPPPGPIEQLEEDIDEIICPELEELFPPDGDIPGVWDCPPYNN